MLGRLFLSLKLIRNVGGRALLDGGDRVDMIMLSLSA